MRVSFFKNHYCKTLNDQTSPLRDYKTAKWWAERESPLETPSTFGCSRAKQTRMKPDHRTHPYQIKEMVSVTTVTTVRTMEIMSGPRTKGFQKGSYDRIDLRKAPNFWGYIMFVFSTKSWAAQNTQYAIYSTRKSEKRKGPSSSGG